jgi:hypothetical protein
MFKQTLQDVLAITEAEARAESLLERVRDRILAFEPFEGGEVLARTKAGLSRFVLAPGLGEAGAKALAALGDERTLRIDTTEELQARGLWTGPAHASLLVLRLTAPEVNEAAIVLGHARAWSFAAAPLSRLRTIGEIALRLLLLGSRFPSTSEETVRLHVEVAGLRARLASLESEIADLRAERSRPRSDRPR